MIHQMRSSLQWTEDIWRVLGVKDGRTLGGFVVESIPGSGAYEGWLEAVNRLANLFFFQKKIELPPPVKKFEAIQLRTDLEDSIPQVDSKGSIEEVKARSPGSLERVWNRPSSIDLGGSWYPVSPNSLQSYPSSVEDRRFPGGSDAKEANAFIQDDEILNILPSIAKSNFLTESPSERVFPIDKIAGNKLVAMQADPANPVVAIIDMMVQPSPVPFMTLTTEEELSASAILFHHLKTLGILFDNVEIKDPSLDFLSTSITEKGPLIAVVSKGEDEHLIIIDEVNIEKKTLNIRDPYHGWSIEIKESAFARVYKGKGLISLSHIDYIYTSASE